MNRARPMAARLKKIRVSNINRARPMAARLIIVYTRSKPILFEEKNMLFDDLSK